KLKVVLPRERGRKKCEMEPDHDVVKVDEIIMLLDSSDDSRKISNNEPLITRKPVEGPPIELLKWYRYDTDLYQADEFPGTYNDTIDNASSDENTIQESQSLNFEGKLKVVLPRERGRKKCEMEPDHDVVKVDGILDSLTW
nr:hypothetical protein [Tanacetum cinerariifolium]